jgi:hypothetical protein
MHVGLALVEEKEQPTITWIRLPPDPELG